MTSENLTENSILEVLLPMETSDLPHLDQEILSFLNNTETPNHTLNTTHGFTDLRCLDEYKINDLYSKHFNNQSLQQNLQNISFSNCNQNIDYQKNLIYNDNLSFEYSSNEPTSYSSLNHNLNSSSSSESSNSTFNDFYSILNQSSTSNSFNVDFTTDSNCFQSLSYFDYECLDELLGLPKDECTENINNYQNVNNHSTTFKLQKISLHSNKSDKLNKSRNKKTKTEDAKNRKLALKLEKKKLRLERKKVQNKEAAKRYREKKRNEVDLIDENIKKLEEKYNKLRHELNEIIVEKKVFLNLLKQIDKKESKTKVEIKFPDWLRK